MGIKWTDEQIKVLLAKAKSTYETDIPLAEEIRRMDKFIHEMFMFADGNDSFKFKLNWLRFSWFHHRWDKNHEIDIPKEVAWKVYHEARAMLDAKCNKLTDLLGLNKQTIKRE